MKTPKKVNVIFRDRFFNKDIEMHKRILPWDTSFFNFEFEKVYYKATNNGLIAFKVHAIQLRPATYTTLYLIEEAGKKPIWTAVYFNDVKYVFNSPENYVKFSMGSGGAISLKATDLHLREYEYINERAICYFDINSSGNRVNPIKKYYMWDDEEMRPKSARIVNFEYGVAAVINKDGFNIILGNEYKTMIFPTITECFEYNTKHMNVIDFKENSDNYPLLGIENEVSSTQSVKMKMVITLETA